MTRRLMLVLALVGSALLTPTQVAAQPANNFCRPGQTPAYTAGFADLKTQLGAAMGDPLTCEYTDPNGSGDIHQDTTTGLAFWRKSTNTPTFTDGFNHWAHTSQGWVTWTGSSIDPPGTAQANVYPDLVVRSFMDSCTGGDPFKQPLCQCALDKIQAQYSLADFINLADRIQNNDVPPELVTITVTCALSNLQSGSDATGSPSPT